MKRLLRLGVVLTLLPTASFAQLQGAAGAAGAGILLTGIALFLHGKKVVQECHNGNLFNVTYLTALGLGQVNVVLEAELVGPCPCDVMGVQFARPLVTDGFSLLRPLKACPQFMSTDTQGNQKTVPGLTAPVSMSGFGGPGVGPPLLGTEFVPEGFRPRDPPPPPSPPFPASLGKGSAPRPVSRAATPASAFTYTLAFRNLPWGPLLADATPSVPFACLSSVNPTALRVYHLSDVVERYNMCTGQIVATIAVPDLPLQVRVTPDGSQAIVASYSGAITFIDTATNTVSGTIQMPNNQNFAPSGIAITPDGSYALVTNYLDPPDSYLSVVDIADKQITGKIPLDTAFPQSVFINPDGTLAWITFPWNSNVEVMDILTGTIVAVFRTVEPFSIAFNPTGTRAFLSSGSGSVQVIDTSNYHVIKTIPADIGATDLQITPDGTSVFVNNSGAKSVTVIETQSLTAASIDVGDAPQGSVLVPVK
jgi:YVTN family beta-propeller protein